MLYRVTVDLFLKSDIEALAIKDFLMKYKDNFLRAGEEASSIIVHKCYHDETPPRPCEEVIFSYNVGR
jgi:hypothetical protein